MENKRKARRIELKEKRAMKRKQKELLLLKKKRKQKVLGITLCSLCLIGLLSVSISKQDKVVEAEVTPSVDITKLVKHPGVLVIEEEIAKRQAEAFKQLRKELKEKAEAERQEVERIEKERLEAERQEAAEQAAAEQAAAEQAAQAEQQAVEAAQVQEQTQSQVIETQPESQPQVQQRTDGFNYNGYHYDTPTFYGTEGQSVPQWTNNIYVWGDAATGFDGYTTPGRHYLVEKCSEAGETIRQLGVGSQVVIDGQTYTVRGVQSGVAIDNVDFAINLWNQGYITWQSCDTYNAYSPQTIWWAS